jgi:hypothetical protein
VNEFFEKYSVTIKWYFSFFLVVLVLILPFVFGDVDRLLNPVIGLDLDRLGAVTGMIDLGYRWRVVLLGLDLEL